MLKPVESRRKQKKLFFLNTEEKKFVMSYLSSLWNAPFNQKSSFVSVSELQGGMGGGTDTQTLRLID